MRELLEQGVGIAIIGGVTAVGVLSRMLLLGYYGRLGRACTKFEETKNKTVTYIREDLRRRSGREEAINNISVYTEYRLAEGKVCGVRVGSLEHAVLYSLFLVGMSSVLVALTGVLTECGYKTVLTILWAGGISVTGLLILDIVTGLREKNKRVRLRIRDYIENGFCAGADKAEREEEKKAEKKEKVNQRTDKPRTTDKKKHGKAQEEKRRLTEELLRERRQLEARSLAEQRRKERETAVAEPATEQERVQAEAAAPEYVEERAQEEAAVTECMEEQEEATVKECPEEWSYEDLINAFLKEYPV